MEMIGGQISNLSPIISGKESNVNIVACVKQVPDTEAQIRVSPDGRGIVESDVLKGDPKAVAERLSTGQNEGPKSECP